MSTAAMRLLVRGRVQGVGFRWATADQARRLGLSGWARNLPDGGVEVVAAGPAPALDALAAWCAHGPPSARVTGVLRETTAATVPAGAFTTR